MISVSIISTCKGRLEYLKESLPSWLAQEVGRHISFETIIVDFGCPDETASWCQSLSDPRVRTVKAASDTDVFNPSRAKNIGGKASSSEFLAFVDADMIVPGDFVRKYIATIIQTNANFCVAGTMIGGAKYTSGLCMVERRVFETVRGYDESIEDYGEEDTDFYRRCDVSGFVRHWVHWDAEHRPCTEEQRTKFYRCKDIATSIQRNKAQTQDPRRQVNASSWGNC